MPPKSKGSGGRPTNQSAPDESYLIVSVGNNFKYGKQSILDIMYI